MNITIKFFPFIFFLNFFDSNVDSFARINSCEQFKSSNKKKIHSVDNDPVEIIKLSMKKAGDYESIKTIKIKTERKNYNKWQNFSFLHPKPTNDDAYRELDFENKRLYSKTISRYGGGYVFEFVTVGSDTTIYSYDVNKSRNGKKLSTGGKNVLENNLRAFSAYLPFYNLKALLTINDSLSSRTENSGPVVTRHLKNGTKTEYYFSKENHQLIRTSNIQTGQVVDTWYKDYTMKNNLLYPQKIEVYINGEPLTKDEVVSIKWNEAFNHSLLAIPKEYVISPVSATEMKVSEISKDVFLIENVQGRNILFINLSDGIFVTEAPLSSDVSKSIIDLIKKTIPGKPVKYVHLSHFHNDHTHGIRQFVYEGAGIVTTPATASALAEVINDNSGRYNDALAKEKKEARIDLFDEHKIIKDANHVIELYTVPSNHAEGISFVYLPKEKLIYQGDLYSLPDDQTITPAIETTREFYKFLKRKNISFKRMIGHHGSSTITPEILEKAILLKK